MSADRSSDDGELARLRRVYERYGSDPKEQAKRDATNPALALIREEFERSLEGLLREERLLPLAGKRILDVGCGSGEQLVHLVAYGADPALCTGIDALPDRVEHARRAHPSSAFLVGDARALPFDDGSFDLVLASLIFGSILDDDFALAAAREIARVVAPGGALVWWENRYDTPGNRDVRGYSRRRLRQLFPSWQIRGRTLTVSPPVARRLGRFAPQIYPVLALVPPLRVRYVAVLRPIDGSSRDARGGAMQTLNIGGS